MAHVCHLTIVTLSNKQIIFITFTELYNFKSARNTKILKPSQTEQHYNYVLGGKSECWFESKE